MPYESFMSEVAPFLETEIADLYDEADWDQMRSSVAIALNELGDRGTTDGAGR